MIMLGIGAAKAGSTWLYEVLKQSRAVEFPMGKESKYWLHRNRKAVANQLKHYPNGKMKLGDVRGEYAFFNDEDIEHTLKLYNEVRVVYILRHPVPRSCAQVAQYCQYLPLPLEDIPPEMAYVMLTCERFFEHNSYGKHYERWIKHCGKENVLLLAFEDIVHQPRAVFCQLLEFMDLDREADKRITDEQLNHRYNKLPRIVPQYVRDQIRPIYETMRFVEDASNLLGREIEDV